MKKISTPRLRWLLWVGGLTVFLAIAVYPLSTRVTRISSIGVLTMLCFGLLALVWRQRVARWCVLGLIGIVTIFVILPGRPSEKSVSLRADYTRHLERYLDVPYFWGGESFKGIDCSGLIRRGLVDSLFVTGVRTLNPRLVRESISLWWHDSSAEALGQQYRGSTVHLLATPSLNALDNSKIQPGDLAVTQSGVHILAYLGNDRWIEADPVVGRVIIVGVPAPGNVWFDSPMKVMRWTVLDAKDGS